MANGSVYFFNMTPSNTLYVILNNTQPALVVPPLNNTAPYNTLGTPPTAPTRVEGVTFPQGQFGDQNSLNWTYQGDSTPRSLPNVSVPTSFDVENDIQVYVFKNSAIVRYGDNALFFSQAVSGGSVQA